MPTQEAYLILDIGTGNVRVAVSTPAGEVLGVERGTVHYEQDERYPEALFFDPDRLWNQICALARKALHQVHGVTIKAVTASSQREGIVLLDGEGGSLIGLPNHDHRGREWEHTVTEKDRVYQLTGRYPTSLFSALKLIGIRERRPDVWKQITTFLSISDWAQYKLSGVARYEHSQASETQLYDVARKTWSADLRAAFGLTIDTWPKIAEAGTLLGTILPKYAADWEISPETPVVVGGADTQLAMKSTQPAVGDVVIVAGTTTPITKVLRDYKVDQKKRTWTSRDIEAGRFVLEANTGVTGLNYQRLKDIFYPNEAYEIIEEELAEMTRSRCMASLGSLLAREKMPLVRGGFVFNVPVSHQLTRADFAWATLWDIACCVRENYESLCRVSPHTSAYVWACGGGMQSPTLRQFIADLIGKELRIRPGYRQASVAGAALLCRQALNGEKARVHESGQEKVCPQDTVHYASQYEAWKAMRETWRNEA